MFAFIERSNNSSMGTKFQSSGEGRGGLEISSTAFENVIEENQKCFSAISRDIHRLSFQQKFSSLIFTTSFSRGKKKKKEEKSNVTPRRNYFPHFQFTPSTCSNPPSALHCPRSGGGRWKFMESENFSENSRLRSDGIKFNVHLQIYIEWNEIVL